MKSKTLRKGTRRRRLRRNVKKTKTKRGGMLRGARSNLGTTIYNEFLPLFTKFNNHIIGQKLTPEQKAVVQNGNRYFETFVDIPADDPLKASITELMKEWSSTEKNAEKTLGFYNKILQTLKDVEKKRKQQLSKDAASNRPSIVTGAFSSNPNSLTSPLVLQGTSYTPHASSSASPFAQTPQSLTNPHFNTPAKRTGNYIGDSTSPPKLNLDEKAPQSINPDGLLNVQGTILFPNAVSDSTPMTSPVKPIPPCLQTKSRIPLSHLSPSKPPRLDLG